jgi:sugar phosphate isomerase/epimerase
MKLSVFTVATPEVTPEQLVAIASKVGIHGIEWRYKEPDPGVENQAPSFWGNNLATINPAKGDAEIDRFRQITEAAGLEIPAITPYLGGKGLVETEKVLKDAKRIGASQVRVGVPNYDGSRNYNELLKEGREYLKGAEALCKQYGVKGLVETHHVTIAASASAAYRLVEGFDPDHIGVLFDPGNMVHEGFENYKMGMELLGPYLAHVHVKNAAWFQTGYAADGSDVWKCRWTGLQQGIVPWEPLIKTLKEIGYDGYLGVEDFSGQHASSEKMLKNYVDYIGGMLAGV